MPSHPLVVAYDAANMSSEALSNMRQNHLARGYTGVDMRPIRLLEVPQGFLGASIYVDFTPPEAIPISFCCGTDYETDFGISACDAASRLIDGRLPGPHFVMHTAGTPAQVAPIVTAGS